jgi:hypothetical protein
MAQHRPPHRRSPIVAAMRLCVATMRRSRSTAWNGTNVSDRGRPNLPTGCTASHRVYRVAPGVLCCCTVVAIESSQTLLHESRLHRMMQMFVAAE